MELSPRRRVAAEIISLVYIAIIALVANATGAFYVLFPELGALSHDVFTRPRGTWANSPIMLAITPVITGAIGIAITRTLPYGFLSVLLNVIGAIVGGSRIALAGRARDFRRPAAAGAGRHELVVSAGNHVRDGAARGTFDSMEAIRRER